jgi:hypothetical protein
MLNCRNGENKMKTLTLARKPELNQTINVELDGVNYQGKIIDKSDSYIICEIDLFDCIDTFTFKYTVIEYKPAYDMVLNLRSRGIFLSPKTEIEMIEKINNSNYFGKFKRLSDGIVFSLLDCQVTINPR